ncbi:MAG: sugar ABC transporter permease [Candidatus Humimicrobiaceae bacterium]|nr:sugar ABC transporter permease [Actinomycetota bacterium]MDD5600185.1 sugar ABC transporter permease [Actinomycetota bacterium]MDY0028212.1 sugar ABC transporter permease [Candidatus Humimicrobiaceae bacterium]
MNHSTIKKPSKLVFSEVWALLKENFSNYAMYVALAAIFILFNITTNGNFLTGRNITNLVNQTGYVAVMAVGMTLVLIIQQIDLSVGCAAGFFGACAALLMRNGMPAGLTILLVLIGGLIGGLCQGFIIGKIGVPAFVTTLAFNFIFRGMLSLVTEATGTIPVTNEFFNEISNGFLPSIFTVAGKHGSTIIIGALIIFILIISQVRERKDTIRYNFKVSSLPIFIVKLLFFSAIIGSLSYVLSSYNGISWTILIVAIVVIIYSFMMDRTKIGRYIYGVGGNREAAALAGVNVKSIVIFSFASMGLMASLGGILFTSRLQSATPTAGIGFELDVIASCFIGGVSTTGGIGRIINSIIGAFVIVSLTNGLNLMGVGISYQYIIKGIIFIIAVAVDVISRGSRAI